MPTITISLTEDAITQLDLLHSTESDDPRSPAERGFTISRLIDDRIAGDRVRRSLADFAGRLPSPYDFRDYFKALAIHPNAILIRHFDSEEPNPKSPTYYTEDRHPILVEEPSEDDLSNAILDAHTLMVCGGELFHVPWLYDKPESRDPQVLQWIRDHAADADKYDWRAIAMTWALRQDVMVFDAMVIMLREGLY